MDIEEFSPLPLLHTQSELVNAIKHLEELTRKHKSDFVHFRESYVPRDVGTATKQVANAIFT